MSTIATSMQALEALPMSTPTAGKRFAAHTGNRQTQRFQNNAMRMSFFMKSMNAPAPGALQRPKLLGAVIPTQKVLLDRLAKAGKERPILARL